MNSSKSWTVLALIIGISGLGLSGYTLFFALPANTQRSGIQNVWHASNTVTSVALSNSDVVLPNLSIVATVNPGESLHVIFNSEAYINLETNPEYIRIRVSLNGHKKGPPATVGGWPDHDDHVVWEHLTLQYSNLTIIPGVYNVSIKATSSDASGNSIYDMSLLVFTTM